jgi:hypothetical protein
MEEERSLAALSVSRYMNSRPGSFLVDPFEAAGDERLKNAGYVRHSRAGRHANSQSAASAAPSSDWPYGIT